MHRPFRTPSPISATTALISLGAQMDAMKLSELAEGIVEFVNLGTGLTTGSLGSAQSGKQGMKVLDIVGRTEPAEPWVEGDKIPWHAPGFSARMLREHLSQEHDAASRRMEKIDRHVAWIHETAMSQVPTRVLDLGCGPGLYTSRLAALGHDCTGIDYSPASIAFARRQATEQGLSCSYVEGDVREVAYGSGHGLVMMLFGELNVFKPEDAHVVLAKAHGALRENGLLLLEPHTFAAVKRMGAEAPTWYSSMSGLFMDAPHLCLIEHHWHEERRAATTRYFVLSATSGEVTRHAQSVQAYTDADYETLLGGRVFRT